MRAAYARAGRAAWSHSFRTPAWRDHRHNVALFLDLIGYSDVNLRLARFVAALAGLLCLLYGFIWDREQAQR